MFSRNMLNSIVASYRSNFQGNSKEKLNIIVEENIFKITPNPTTGEQQAFIGSTDIY